LCNLGIGDWIFFLALSIAAAFLVGFFVQEKALLFPAESLEALSVEA
jgi:hypothetical protein